MSTQSSQSENRRVEAKRPLGVRVTAKEHRLLTEAAEREHRSVNSFVVQAALRAAEDVQQAPPRSLSEIKEIFAATRAQVRAVAPPGRDLLEDFLLERRREAARE